MQSKKFCFSINKAILKRNMKAFWPVALLYLIYLSIFVTVRMSSTIAEYKKYNMNPNPYFASGALISMENGIKTMLSTMTEPISVAIIAVLAVLCVFGYLYKNRTGNMIHSFPVTKGILFSTNIVSALLMLFIPQVITFVLTTVITLVCNIGVVQYLAMWLVFEMLYTLFFVGFAAFIAMFTGQAWVVVLFYAAFNFVYLCSTLLWYLIRQIVSADLLMSDVAEPDVDTIFTPVIYLTSNTGFPNEYLFGAAAFVPNSFNPVGVPVAFIYAAVGCMFAVAAYFVYRYRANERGGDFLSIPVTKPAFRFLTGLFGGVAVGMFITYVLLYISADNSDNLVAFLVFMVFFVLVFYCIAEMFVRKSYRIFSKRFFAEACVCCVFVCALVGFARSAAIRDSKYVPDPAAVTMAGLNGEYVVATMDDDEIKKKVLAINSFIVDHYDEVLNEISRSRKVNTFYDENTDYLDFRLRFELNSGAVYSKDVEFYYDKTDEQSLGYQLNAMCKDLYDDPESYKRYLFTDAYDRLELNDVKCNYIYTYDEDGYYTDNDAANNIYESVFAYISARSDLRKKLYEAILKDIDSGNIDYRQYPDYTELELGMTFTLRDGVFHTATGIFWDNKEHWRSGDEPMDYTTRISLNDKYSNTARFIESVLNEFYDVQSYNYVQ